MFCVLYSQHDTAFAILLSFAVLFFPMALLGVAVTGSLYAINPVSLVTSIFRTFPQYMGILGVFYGGFWAFSKTASFLPQLWMAFPVRRLLFFYLTMVMAHILGRFYWRYEERLDLEL
jgi:hypothetical protein